MEKNGRTNVTPKNGRKNCDFQRMEEKNKQKNDLVKKHNSQLASVISCFLFQIMICLTLKFASTMFSNPEATHQLTKSFQLAEPTIACRTCITSK